jgi:hypothetical protein
MGLVVAAFNIEKNGQSSELDKQAKVSEFINFCCTENLSNYGMNKLGADIIFLCEVHSARTSDYENSLVHTYSDYSAPSLSGGHSNAYVVLYRNELGIELEGDQLQGLNRSIVALKVGDLRLGLAHFKSGQNGLTASQIVNASAWLEEASPGRWAITGDMNWNFQTIGNLGLPGGSHSTTCWDDQTQVSGGILDWCLAGGATTVKPLAVQAMFPSQMFDMTGPDHRPVMFAIE